MTLQEPKKRKLDNTVDPHAYRKYPQDREQQRKEIYKVAQSLLGQDKVTLDENGHLIYTTKLPLYFESYSDSCELTMEYSPAVERKHFTNPIWKPLIESCGIKMPPPFIKDLLEGVTDVNPDILHPYLVFDNYFKPLHQLQPIINDLDKTSMLKNLIERKIREEMTTACKEAGIPKFSFYCSDLPFRGVQNRHGRPLSSDQEEIVKQCAIDVIPKLDALFKSAHFLQSIFRMFDL